MTNELKTLSRTRALIEGMEDRPKSEVAAYIRCRNTYSQLDLLKVHSV